MSVIALPRGANRAARFMPLVAIMLAGAALRLYLIADKSLWLDEAFSVWMGWQPLGAMWRYLVQLDQHPPLYYTLLHFWMWLGDSETVVRSFSALWGILTLPVIYAIGVRVGGPALGRLASLILALAPMHVQYAQDARMYAMLTFTASMALLCMVQLLGSGDEGPTTKDEAGPTAVVQPAPLVDSHSKPHPTWFGSINRWWLGLVIFTTLTMLGHNTALTFPLAQGLFIAGGLGIPALLRRACGADASLQARRLREWSLALGASLLLWLPWLPGLLVQVRRVDQEFWIPAPTWRSVVATWRDFVSAFGPNGPSIALILLAAGALALLGIWRLRRRPALLALLLLLIVVPFAGELLASLRRPIYYTRTLIWASIPFYVLLAAGLLQLRFRPLIVIATLALLLLNGASLANYYRNFEPEGWREAAGWLAPQVRGGDIILFNAGWTQIPFDYYYRQVGPLVEQRGLPADLFDRGILEPKMTDADVERLSQLIAGREHVWLVYSHNWYTDPQSIIPRYLGATLARRAERQFNGLAIFRYEPR